MVRHTVHLPPELLFYIATFIRSPKELARVSLTCKSLRHATRPQVFQSISLYIVDPAFGQNQHGEIQITEGHEPAVKLIGHATEIVQSELAVHVKTLRLFVGTRGVDLGGQQTFTDALEQLLGVLDALPNLRTIHLDAPNSLEAAAISTYLLSRPLDIEHVHPGP